MRIGEISFSGNMFRRILYGACNVPTKFRQYIQFKFRSHINFRCRIALYGAKKVGKSAIIQQFLNEHFPTKHIKTTEELSVTEFTTSNGDTLTLEILDTAGSINLASI